MAIRQVTISQKDSTEKLYFRNKIDIVSSPELSDDLLKHNYFAGDHLFSLEKEDGSTYEKIFQIRINLSQVGVFMVFFDDEAFDNERKRALVEKISSLKGKGNETPEDRKAVVPILFAILQGFDPILVGFQNTTDEVLTRSSFEDLLKDVDTSFPLLLLVTSVEEETPEEPKKQPKVKKEKPVKKAVEKKEKAPKESGRKFDIVGYLKSLASVDFVFFAIFAAFISFGLVVSLHQIMSGEGIAVFLMNMTVLFVITLYYATYRSYVEDEKFSIRPSQIYKPGLYIVVGLVVGFIIGYYVATMAFKQDPENPINIELIYTISIPVASFFALASLVTPIPIDILVKKIKRKKQ